MKNLIRSNKGISLIELLVSLPLAVLIITGVSFSLLHFINSYQEVKLYTQLQEDLFNAIETMRYGYSYKTYTHDEGLIGLSTAKSVKLSQTVNQIEINPVIVEEGLGTSSYWSRFTLDNNGHLNVTSRYGLQQFDEPKQIFPSTPTKMIDNQPQFKILNPYNVWSVEKTDGNGNPVLLKISLEGRVRFRKKGQNQSNEDDIRNNTKTVKYETSVFIGNTEN